MNKSLVAVIIIVLVAIGGVGFLLSQGDNQANSESSTSQSSVDENATSSVSIEYMSFSTSSVTIKKGTTVTWTNKDLVAHTVTSDEGDFLSSSSLARGDSYTKTFNETGTFAYHCTPHPFMKAKVIVTE